MTDIDSRKADRIYREALDLPEPERDAHITTSCEGDGELEALVRRLVEQTGADDSRIVPGGGMRLFGAETDDFAPRPVRTLAAGTRIGNYRIERMLGRGGMATVYLAERADGQFEQQVALKVLDRAGDSVARFEQERQILAALNHPSIARLYDAGTTDDGLSWVVMEYVEGQPLLEYCDARQLGIEARLRLLIPIVDAVHEAHRRLIVHRDIKSSNIVVSEDGVPKLLDFGIAKLLAPDAMPNVAPETRVGVPLTPEYASPEQIRNEQITVASDIYQLGYLLYGLLTGRSPYPTDPLDMAALVNAITRTEPAAPSSCFREADRERAARHGSTPAALTARLAGDLDRVTLTALHKDPERRYESAAKLREDIGNVLARRPISAHPDSLYYLAGKFVQRHRVGVTVTTIALIAVVAGAAIFTVGLARQKARAEAEAVRAREVSAFLVDLVNLSEAERKASRQITVREMLDRAAKRATTGLGSQPRLKASLQNVIGQMYRELGTYEQSGRMLEQSLAILNGLPDDTRDDLADIHLQRARLFLYQGLYEEALAEVERSLALIRERRIADPTLQSMAMAARGRAERMLGKLDEARATLLDAQERQRRTSRPDARAAASIELELGNVEFDASRFDEARGHFRRTIDMLEAGIPGGGLDRARAYMRLGMLEAELNDLDAAETFAKAALAAIEEVHGPDHPDRLFPLQLLSSIDANRGRYEDADATLQELLRNNIAVYGRQHPETATLLNNLGTLRFRQARFDEAAGYYRQAVEMRTALLGAEHPITAVTLSFEAYALHLAGDPGTEARYREALRLLTAAYEPDHRYIANMQHDLGRLYVEQGRYAEAETYLRDAMATRVDVFGDDNLRVKSTKLYLGACLAGLGRLEEAGELLMPVREWTDETYGADSEEAVHTNIWVADWLRRSGRVAEGRALIAEAVGIVEPEYDEDYWLLRSARAIQAKF